MPELIVYLDNCAFNRPFDDQRQIRIFLETQAKLYIQYLITSNKIGLICSYMSYFENVDNPHKDRRFSIAEFFKHAKKIINYDRAEKVEEKASGIMKYSIRNKDAIHIACAIVGGCDYFITTDDDLIKKYTGNEIRICDPIDFITILGGED